MVTVCIAKRTLSPNCRLRTKVVVNYLFTNILVNWISSGYNVPHTNNNNTYKIRRRKAICDVLLYAFLALMSHINSAHKR